MWSTIFRVTLLTRISAPRHSYIFGHRSQPHRKRELSRRLSARTTRIADDDILYLRRGSNRGIVARIYCPRLGDFTKDELIDSPLLPRDIGSRPLLPEAGLFIGTCSTSYILLLDSAAWRFMILIYFLGLDLKMEAKLLVGYQFQPFRGDRGCR